MKWVLMDTAQNLDACLINESAYDYLRVALFLPSMKEASTVAQNIFELCDRRTDGARFEAVGAALTRLVDVEAHSSGPPNNFMEHALDTYLEAVKSEKFYLSIDDLLSAAEGANENLIVTRLVGEVYEVAGVHIPSRQDVG